MITSLLKFVPNDEWIKTSSGMPWLRLSMSVPFDAILEEANSVYSMAVNHRYTDEVAGQSHSGWKSLSLYGEASDITHHTDGKKSWTDISKLCPNTVEMINNYYDINEDTGRIRFMWLDPNGYILPHVDRDKKGFYETNIAISQPDNCTFRFLNYGTVPFKTGDAYLVDISNQHFVVNDSAHIRTHLIVHAKFKPGILKKSYEQNFYN
jgi:hypothetical protein